MAMVLADIKAQAVEDVATALRIKNSGDVALQSDYEDSVRELVEPIVEAIYDALVNDAEVVGSGDII
jgi:hypothetical protein